jgi:hypothetical protein
MHIDHLTTKLSTACYVIRSIKPLKSHKTLLFFYNSPFCTVMNYGIMFWGNSYHITQIFQMQKRLIKSIMGCRNKESCRIFQKTILLLMSQYTISLLIFLVNKRIQFLINSEIHNINTWHSSNLHLPSANLRIYQKGVYYSGIKFFNSFPCNIKKCSDNLKVFKSALTLSVPS